MFVITAVITSIRLLSPGLSPTDRPLPRSVASAPAPPPTRSPPHQACRALRWGAREQIRLQKNLGRSRFFLSGPAQNSCQKRRAAPPLSCVPLLANCRSSETASASGSILDQPAPNTTRALQVHDEACAACALPRRLTLARGRASCGVLPCGSHRVRALLRDRIPLLHCAARRRPTAYPIATGGWHALDTFQADQ